MTDYAGADYARDAAAVQEATDRLLTAVAALDEASLTRPSELPGWTRGHVLAHLARNADAMVNLLTWARTGEETPMYPDAETRDADIRRDADRPLAVHLDDLRTSATRFDAAVAALPPERLPYEVTPRGGVREPAAGLPLRRLTEVELHHVDLGVGRTVTDLPATFVESLLTVLIGTRFAGRPDIPPLRLATGPGEADVRHTGRPAAPGESPVTVTGSPAALLGWLTGRTDGAGLSCPDGPLPLLPALG
ncbi:maleylpyruvate isomerase family mycothiol-dependent enzyme [Streptomyces rapamycinicus]|uniref:Maleylpyruvate isomerase n=2 Tax=Streptomyces rapamycinicus TaxID=1226757 RepID=A0A0A0NND1_STRRN|nr:maleylpyruvate isomerase family mycothiol-dependent enzyme [Streptomyces rapamycinicus]AGP58716.1 maleylpyruvate isomerase [Streptomyces rapamycinicus NRRL 5491]MBB4786430.1 maleylpyruvate isomerase [Streptomyces rapamycinicus]RLV78110.1 maleylpyruvate isomerase [Streptomyces rapamycinicus NRRL 5491]UTO66523.1 maleylpyruvate isomerase family mycothiol-dependent enzyme [Streptomyces rapamycinicus]UTP34477.1 maleylpyruvate isomerase family mycothiol-dependent enzyme [Streptomyces rapamycinicu